MVASVPLSHGAQQAATSITRRLRLGCSRSGTPESAPREYATTQNNLGLALHDRKDYVQAIEAYGQALVADPENGTAHYNTACAYALLGDPQKAVAWLEKAIALEREILENVNKKL